MAETVEIVVTEPGDGFGVFYDRAVVAMRVNGELRDLAHRLEPGDRVRAVAIDSPDGLDILRHSTAHVLAQAVQSLHPQATLGIGPPVTDGFYYDFGVDSPFTVDDFGPLRRPWSASSARASASSAAS